MYTVDYQTSTLWSISFIQVLRDFKRPDGMTEKEIDAAGDGKNFNSQWWLPFL